MDDTLGGALESMALSIGALCGLPEFAPLYLPSESAPAEVETVQGTIGTSAAEPGVIRGRNDVRAQFKSLPEPEPEPTPAPGIVVAGVLYAGGAFAPGLRVDGERLELRSAAVRTAREKVIAAVLDDLLLRSRLRDRWGLRSADAPSDESFFLPL